MIENWKIIPKFERYEASSLGRIRVCKKIRQSRFEVGYVLHPTTHYKTKYLSVMLTSSTKNPKRILVHRAILQAFSGQCPDKMQCRHIDGNRKNNKISNLLWGTRIQNAADRVIHGTAPIGERNGFSKLNSKKVRKIRRFIKEGLSQYKIAAIFGVSQGLINQINIGKIWRYVK